MKKAKTRKNTFTILTALMSVVFALITGVTYCLSSLNLTYGINPNSTSAYLGNQQYHIVNDTINNSIPFGDGSRNFEIALQYSYDYDFDVRFTYTMTWYDSDGKTEYKDATNVVLQFANRDNIIYDEKYIFIADSITKGSGKLTFITGVSFVDTSSNQTEYFGKVLKIDITDTAIYKTESSYSLSSSYLTKNITDNEAAQMWIYHKNKNSATNAYAMVYNYRRSYDYGVSYPGLDTAYKKPVATETYTDTSTNTDYVQGYVYAPVWSGGNRSYAGVGMYVVTGKSSITLSVEVSGIWRNSSGVNITDKSIISENSIRFNSTSNWSNVEWDDSNLWETIKLDYTIPAGTSTYIDILDNVEITCISNITTNVTYDAYRAVVNAITVNGTTFLYDEANNANSFIQIKTITTSEETASNTWTTTSDDKVSIVNTSLYSNGLYSASIGDSTLSSESSETYAGFYGGKAQTFNTNVSLINNTATTQEVTLKYALKYHLSNGSTTMNRPGDTDTSNTDSFASNAYYTYEATYGSETSVTILLAPHSSVNVIDLYEVEANFQPYISKKLDPFVSNAQADKRIDCYDVWTYLDVTEISVKESTDTTETTYNLDIETVQDETKVTLYVKNNTNKIVKNVSISNVVVKEMSQTASYSTTGITAPTKDWSASYWQYYSRSGSEGAYLYTQLTTQPTTQKASTTDGTTTTYYLAFTTESTYYKKTYDYYSASIAKVDSASLIYDTSTGKYTGSGLTLQPGESIAFATTTVKSGAKVYVAGTATATESSDANDIMLIDNGKSTAYIINNSTNSYYVRFTGTVNSTSLTVIDDVKVGSISNVSSYNYYIGIVRPNQIISVPMSESGALSAIAESDGVFASTDLSGWDSTVIAKFAALFNTNKGT